MRVLVLAPSLERPGGVSRSVRRIVGSLRRAGHDVLTVHPDEELFPGDLRREEDELRFGPRARGSRDLEASCGEHAAVAVAAIERGPSGAPDVVLGFYATTAGHAAVRVAEKLRLPSVVAARGNDVDRDLEGEGPAATSARLALTRATAVTAVSTAMVVRLRERLGLEATFVTNAVDPDRFFPDPAGARAFAARAGLAPGRKVLGLFGELKAKRGLSVLRRVPRELLAAFEILVVGLVRPEARGDLPEAARWIPYLDDDETLRAAYGACHAILQPSVQDGMPNVVLEAMACGRAVIASRAGGLADLVTDGITGLACETPAEWTRALREVQAGRTDALGETARARLPTLDAEREAIEATLQLAIRRYTESSASR